MSRRFLAVRVLAALMLTLALAAVPVSPASAAVRSCTNSTPVASRPTLCYGDTGSCVKVLQSLLPAKGYSIGSTYATGTFSTGTLHAVRRFQSSYRYLAIDGIVGPNTWEQLVDGGGPRYSTARGPNTSSRVVLSYDGCPTSSSAFRKMILAAEDLNVALVLFPIGTCITAGTFVPSQARAHGHYVFNHSVTHPHLTTLSYAKALAELGSPGVVTNYGRPPFGEYDLTVRNAYAAKAMRMWLWSLDTVDWKGKSQAVVVDIVVDRSAKGDTVLMHMAASAFNPTALRQMKAGLAARGIGVCRNYPGTTPARPAPFVC